VFQKGNKTMRTEIERSKNCMFVVPKNQVGESNSQKI